MAAVGLSFVAGLLTALSPCVLPALPLVAGSAAAARRAGPLALAAGLTVAFTVVGVVLANAGDALGLADEAVRRAAAVLLLSAGLTTLIEPLQHIAARAFAPLATRAARASHGAGAGLGGQFAAGVLLGAVWSPCVGPTLGAAIGLAGSASASSRASAAVMMFAFGAGATVPLLAAAYASRRLAANRLRLIRAGVIGKRIFGAALVLMGTLVLSGVDRAIEAAVLLRLPQWWVDLLASV